MKDFIRAFVVEQNIEHIHLMIFIHNLHAITLKTELKSRTIMPNVVRKINCIGTDPKGLPKLLLMAFT
jgi:hypothetical protein